MIKGKTYITDGKANKLFVKGKGKREVSRKIAEILFYALFSIIKE